MTRELYAECPGCAAAMRYAAGTGSMKCDHCGHRTEIDVAEGEEVRLFDFEKALADPELLRPFQEIFPGGHEVECERCGGHTVLEGQADHCPHCGNPVLHEVPAGDLISPDSILPFVLDREAAEADFDTWLRLGRLSDPDHAAVLQSATFDGVYLPHWSFTWRSTIFYSGKSGEKSPWFKDRISWTQTGGAVRHEFEDVVASATRWSPGDPPHWSPWETNDLVPFDPSYLRGFQARRYDRDLREAYREALARQSSRIHGSVRSDIFGTYAEVESTEVINENIRFRHCLLPAWIVRYSHREKDYRALIDGETGQVYGERVVGSALGFAAAAFRGEWPKPPDSVRHFLKIAAVPAAYFAYLYFFG